MSTRSYSSMVSTLVRPLILLALCPRSARCHDHPKTGELVANLTHPTAFANGKMPSVSYSTLCV